MSNKPIFLATHPRACSTAFERVFMTRRDCLTCIHEPFGDAYYFGPERLGERYENDEKARLESGFAESTFKTVVERLEREEKQGKRLFIKDMTHYIVPPDGKKASIAPSLVNIPNGTTTTNGSPHANATYLNGSMDSMRYCATNGITNGHKTPYPYGTSPEPNNPTVIPLSLLSKFHFTFLIRHPRSAIPSYYRCTIPPLSHVTGFDNFLPSEAGYDELRRVFDYLLSENQIGRAGAEHSNGVKSGDVNITVIDADDLLDHPNEIVESYCNAVGIEFDPAMLTWEGEEDSKQAVESFEKWRGFHEDAIRSSSLRPRTAARKKIKTVEAENQEWAEKYGEEAARVIRECVDANIPDYEYLKGFAIKI